MLFTLVAICCFLAGSLVGERIRIHLRLLVLPLPLSTENEDNTSFDNERGTVVDDRSQEEREQALALVEHFLDFEDEPTQCGIRTLVEVYWEEEPNTFNEERC
jgi:hypothetical protein